MVLKSTRIKLNLFSSAQNFVTDLLEFIQVVDEKIQPKPSARNLAVIIDQCLDLTDHVKKICVSCQYHLIKQHQEVLK